MPEERNGCLRRGESLKIRREKSLAIFVGTCMILTLCMVGFVTTADASGYVYVDAPTGDPVLDYEAIQGALDAMSPGDTVVLAPGEYSIYKTLVKVGFHGSIVGAGMDDTVIKAVDGPSGYFEASHNPVMDGTSAEGSEDYYTSFFLFGSPQKKLAVSDLSLYLDEETFVEMSYTTFPEDPTFYWTGVGEKMWSAIEIVFAQGCDTSFDNVRVTGVPGLGWAGSPRNGISFWHCDGGKHTLSNSILENIGSFSYGPYLCTNGKYVVKSSQFINGQRGVQAFNSQGLNVRVSDSTFTGLAFPGVVSMYLGSSHMTVTRNTFVDCVGGFWALTWPGYPTVGSNYIVSQNTVDMPAWFDFAGLEVWDQSDVKSHFVMVQNTIHHEFMIAPYGGISLNGVCDSVIANNEITGFGPAAIFVGTWNPDLDTTGNTIINNDVQGFSVIDGVWHDFETGLLVPAVPYGHIYLGSASSYNIVVLGSSTDTYLDMGDFNLVVERG